MTLRPKQTFRKTGWIDSKPKRFMWNVLAFESGLSTGLGFICTKNCQNMYIYNFYVIIFGKIWTINLKSVKICTYIYICKYIL